MITLRYENLKATKISPVRLDAPKSIQPPVCIAINDMRHADKSLDCNRTGGKICGVSEWGKS